jgi:hypothetical protein
MFRGALHVHSTYSDGEFTLAELREVYLEAGCDFVCMTDHAEAFDDEKLASYVNECRALSDDDFVFVAGLEFTCDRRMHVLGFGVSAPARTTDPQEAIRHIRRENGVAVIAHPMDSMFEWIESFDELPDGIETWNTKYDGRNAPRPATFDLLQRLQRRRNGVRAFYGQDMHWKKQHRGLFNVVSCAAPTRDDILRAMVEGNYFAVKGDLRLSATGALTDELRERFGKANEASARRRKLVKGAKRAFDRLGIRVPAPIKAQLRRIF